MNSSEYPLAGVTQAPKGIRVRGLDKENGERLARLVAAVSTAPRREPREVLSGTYEAGFDNGRHFMADVVTRLLGILGEDVAAEVALNKVVEALSLMTEYSIKVITHSYAHNPSLSADVANRLADAS